MSNLTETSFEDYTAVQTVVPVVRATRDHQGHNIEVLDEGDHWLLRCDFDQIQCDYFTDAVYHADMWLDTGHF